MSQLKRILIVNNNRTLSRYFEEGISKLGYEVNTVMSDVPTELNQKNIVHRLKNIFYRNIRNDPHYFTRLKKKHFTEFYTKSLSDLEKKSNHIYDYTIVFRADKYNKTFLEKLKKISKNMVAYQYDGIGAKDNLEGKRQFFSAMHVFDREDVIRFPSLELEFSPNFYVMDESSLTEDEYMLFYLGSFRKDRINVLNQFSFIESKKFIVRTDDKIPDHIVGESIQVTNRIIDYEENLEMMKKAKAILDIKLEYHNGLSFRFFEALYYGKKIITNNETIRTYDFYHPNNILIVDYSMINKQDVINFLATKMTPIHQTIIDKYSLNSWLSNIFKLNTSA